MCFQSLSAYLSFGQTIDTNNVNVALGIPTDNDNGDDYLIFRPQYVVSYNQYRNSTNWVSWELNSNWYGETDRYKGNFIADTSLPDLFYMVKHSDYTNSGFDRGHIVRSKDRSDTEENNKSTFLLTNIMPQTPDLNRGVWLNFEYYVEKLCTKENKELFVIAGGIYKTHSKMNNTVEIPDSCFKIVVVLDKGQTLKDVSESTETIAVVMPNIEGVRGEKWERYKTTIRQIENSVGYDFLCRVPIDIQNKIETR